MCFFLYNLEELYDRSCDGGNRSIVATFPDTKTLFVDFIYRCRSGASTFERTIPKGLPESNSKKPLNLGFSLQTFL